MCETENTVPASAAGRPLWRWILIFACLVFAFTTSFYSWTHNSHERKLGKRFPSWYRDGYVLFDGYGNYTEQLRDMMRDSERAGPSFRHFTSRYIHTNTPLYPLLSAILSLTGLSIVWSCFAVNLVASLVCLFLFYQLLRQRAVAAGWPEILTFLTFLLHCSVLSGLARPLPDMMALAVLLAFLWTCRRYNERHERRWLVVAAGLCALGILTKTILYLLVPLFALVLLREIVTGSRWTTRRRVLVGLTFGVVAIAGLIGVILVLRNTSSMRFVLNISRNAFAAWFNANDRPLVIRGGIAFLALSLGLFPLVVAAGWTRDLVRVEMEHVAWLAMYLGQRILFAGFNLGYGRARYGIPLVASLAILCLPGYRRLWNSRRWRWLAPVPILLHLAIWLYFLYKLSMLPKGAFLWMKLPI